MEIIFNILNFVLLFLTYYIVTKLFTEDVKIINNKIENANENKNKKRIGLLTNEIPPIIYGGVATWIVNFIKMFEDNQNYEIVPIFLAYNDLHRIDSIKGKYKNLRIIYNKNDIKDAFNDIDICLNNIWIALDTIVEIKKLYPKLPVISVCHSLIKMEHLTNLGSVYTNNFFDQEITFMNSDVVVLISNAEEKYFKKFGYDKYGAKTFVIYNSYKSKFNDKVLEFDYNNDDVGYIGRHVPRKRPELAILSVYKTGRKDINVYNMGVDFKNGSNLYWQKLSEIFEEQLTIIPFTSDKSKIENFWKNIGVNCITGIYEPFGYTICEALDRRIPLIVQNIDGPSEIIKGFEDYVYMYNVDSGNLINDVNNFTEALEKFWKTSPEQRKINSQKARQALKRFQPSVIKDEWLSLFEKCNNGTINIRNGKDKVNDNEIIKTRSYKGYFSSIENMIKNTINKLF